MQPSNVSSETKIVYIIERDSHLVRHTHHLEAVPSLRQLLCLRLRLRLFTMHISNMLKASLICGLTTLFIHASAQVSIGPVTIGGTTVIPGPAITGINSESDLNYTTFDKLLSSGGLRKRSVAGEHPSCGGFFNKCKDSDAETLVQYFHNLPATQQCVVQNPQYASDCNNMPCVNMAVAGTAQAWICLYGDQPPYLSFAAVPW
jgi:hypothetical protein